MGANNSSELDNQRIAEIATEANGQFAKEFSFAFKDAVISKIKNAYLQSNIKLALLQADVPCQNVKTGYLLKIGANVKSWKRRKFVAKNKSDNYCIVYYEDEQEIKEKGKFSCCGYTVESFSPEETNWYGLYGIKLKSHDDSKRMWLFRAESEEDQQQWVEVFMNACKKAKPDVQRDNVYVEAFNSAYRVTRAAYGYFGVFDVIGSEVEMLEYLTNQILAREMIDQYIVERGARSNSVARKNLMINVHHSVLKTVRPIVASTWRSSFAAVEIMKASFELSVKASLRLVLDKEAEIRAFLMEKVRGLVDPYMVELHSKTCLPVLKHCFAATVEAYEQALLGFHKEMHKILGSIEFYPDTQAREMLRVEELLEQTAAGPLANSQRVLWRMHTSDLTDVQDTLQQAGISGYDLYISTMDDLKTLLQNALHTFNKLSQQPPPANKTPSTPTAGSTGLIIPPIPPASVPTVVSTVVAPRRPLTEVLSEVITKLTADAKVLLQRGLVTFLEHAVECKVQEMMVAPCYEVALSAQHLVTRETQLMINLNSLGEQLVRDLVRQHLTALMSDLAAEASSRLNMVAVQLMDDASA